MDPLTQGLTGIIVPQAVADKKTIRYASLAGLIGGILPDADIFIHSVNDPLFNLLIHRHFTHALAFIPVGGLIAALLTWLLIRRRLDFKKTYLFATLGYATGGILDACTSYGTYLYWPFFNQRVAWDNISIIDPIYSLILGVFIILAFRKKARKFAFIGTILGLCYLSAGFAARNTAIRILADNAEHRGDTIDHIRVIPTIGNLILWRGIYEQNDAFHVHAIRLGLFSAHQVYVGPTVQKFQPVECATNPHETRRCRNIKCFSHFADGYVFKYSEAPLIIGDLRYAMLPHQIAPLWGLVVNPKNPENLSELKYFDRIHPETIKDYWQILTGSYP